MDLKITLVLTQQTPAASVVDIAISRKRDNLALPCGGDGVSGSWYNNKRSIKQPSHIYKSYLMYLYYAAKVFHSALL